MFVILSGYIIAEFAIAHIKENDWNPSSFENLVIPDKRKKIIRALVENHAAETSFDDFITGKGKGLVVLLQYD